MSINSLMEEAAAEATEKQHVMKVMDPAHGDFRVTWDPSRDEEVKQARETFKKLKRKGMAAYRVNEDGKKADLMHDFDPNAKAMIMAPALAGG
jgi:hypothetical protein